MANITSGARTVKIVINARVGFIYQIRRMRSMSCRTNDAASWVCTSAPRCVASAGSGIRTTSKRERTTCFGSVIVTLAIAMMMMRSGTYSSAECVAPEMGLSCGLITIPRARMESDLGFSGGYDLTYLPTLRSGRLELVEFWP